MKKDYIIKKNRKKIIVDIDTFLKETNKKNEIIEIINELTKKDINDSEILRILEVFEYENNNSIEFKNIIICKKDNNIIFKKKNKFAYLWFLLFFLFSFITCVGITYFWATTYYNKIKTNENTCDKCKRQKKRKNKEQDHIIIDDNSVLNVESGGLIITYKNSIDTGVIPDDMEDSVPIKESSITIKNTADADISYNLVWNIIKNNFESDHFKFILTSSNGGANTELTTVPKTNETIAKNIIIKARSTQNYTLSFRLVGVNKPQNEDQNKQFDGRIDVQINQLK